MFQMPPAFLNKYDVPNREIYLRLNLAQLLIERKIINDYLEDYESGRVVNRGWTGHGGSLTWREMELGQNYAKLYYIDELIEMTTMTKKWQITVTKDFDQMGENYVFAESVSVTPTGDLIFYDRDNRANYGISSGYWIRFKLMSANGEESTRAG